MHRSKNSAKESCVAASAEVTSIEFPVLLGDKDKDKDMDEG